MGLALENIGQRDGRSAHIAVFGSSLVELPQVYRAAADRYDLKKSILVCSQPHDE